jgi:hypothetical protein
LVIGVRLLQRDDLAPAQAGVGPEQYERQHFGSGLPGPLDQVLEVVEIEELDARTGAKDVAEGPM